MNKETLPYKIQGRPMTEMFNRADMSFLGFSYGEVEPPKGHELRFDKDGEPIFVRLFTPKKGSGS